MKFAWGFLAILVAGLFVKPTAADEPWGDAVTIAYNCNALYRPNGNARPCVQEISNRIKDTKNKLLILFYYRFNNQPIIDALDTVMSRAVGVRPVVVLVVDESTVDNPSNSERTDYNRWTAGGAIGVKLRGRGTYGIMHNKILASVREETVGGRKTWVGTYATGSYNFTNNAAYNSFENFIFLETSYVGTILALLEGIQPLLQAARPALTTTLIRTYFGLRDDDNCSGDEMQVIGQSSTNILTGAVNITAQCFGLHVSE